MTDSQRNCTDGRDASEILAYLEGELSEHDRAKFEAHVRVCRTCSEELGNLRRIRSLLHAHPESFHLDAADLYRYIAHKSDPDGQVAAHLRICEACRNTATLMEEMIAMGAQAPRKASPLPQALQRQLEELHPPRRIARPQQPESRLLAFLRRPFRIPALALGTAAAVVLVALLVPRLWHTLQEVLQPGSSPGPGVTAPASQPREAGARDALQALPQAPAAPTTEAGERKQSGAVPERQALVAPRLKEEEMQRAGKKARAMRSAPMAPHLDKAAPGMPSLQSGGLAGSQAVPGSSEAESPGPLAAAPVPPVYQSRRETVAVRIEGPEGQHLPALLSAIPDELRQRYAFVQEPAAESSREKGKAAGAWYPWTRRGHNAAAQAALRITIKIFQTGGGYTVEGWLYEGDSSEESKTITELEVPLEKLPQKVGNLVQDLLASLEN